MPRAIWSGAIQFGLVNIPVNLYSAIDEQDLRFHFVHRPDGSRIGYEKVCTEEGRPVPDDEIVKAFEISDGQYVYLEDEDFEAAEGEARRAIEITDFVRYEEIDPIFFERTYYLGPDEGAEKVYALLVRAMEKAGLAAIATYVMRNRQQLGCLRVRDRVITLEKMYFADEIRPVDEIRPNAVSVGKKELEMAAELIERFTGSFDPAGYRDEYRDALLEVIEAKKSGGRVEIDRGSEPNAPTDLLEALRASVAARTGRSASGNGSRRSGRNGSGPGPGAEELEALTKAELVRRAKRAGLTGYSAMKKRELVRALADLD